jgi:putative oxygen-independent coproporphyrinogen III oxidase
VLGETSPRNQALGLYVHVPFCAKRCHYCSFNTAVLEDDAMVRFLAALGTEIDMLGALPWARSVRIETIFLGGGTPSLLAADDMAAILDGVRARLSVERGAEVTVECNPESVTRDKLVGYGTAGVNRISLGVQSLDDSILPVLGRLHDARGARAAFAAAREAGFDNVSVDLMYGLPALDVASWRRGVETVLDWEPEHLSAYGLTLDGGSAWSPATAPALPPETIVVEQYWALARVAAARGYEHYEISNYARPGFRSRHNQVYWRAAEYLACGPGGCGFIGDVRYGNVRATPRYCATLEAGALPIDGSERLTPRQRVAERLILGLRTADGVPAAWLDERGRGDRHLSRTLQTWRERGLLVALDDRARLSEAGFLLSDALFVDLL